jgi:hypothetical protein
VERTVRANGLDLWCETFGDPDNPSILLIMGIGWLGPATALPSCHV